MKQGIWKDGKAVDLWTVPHVLSGVAAASAATLTKKGLWTPLAVSVAAMTAWEGFEVAAKVEEAPWNRVMDVVSGAAGFLVAYPLLRSRSKDTKLIAAGTFTVLWLGMSLLGRQMAPKNATPV